MTVLFTRRLGVWHMVGLKNMSQWNIILSLSVTDWFCAVFLNPLVYLFIYLLCCKLSFYIFSMTRHSFILVLSVVYLSFLCSIMKFHLWLLNSQKDCNILKWVIKICFIFPAYLGSIMYYWIEYLTTFQ